MPEDFMFGTARNSLPKLGNLKPRKLKAMKNVVIDILC